MASRSTRRRWQGQLPAQTGAPHRRGLGSTRPRRWWQASTTSALLDPPELPVTASPREVKTQGRGLARAGLGASAPSTPRGRWPLIAWASSAPTPLPRSPACCILGRARRCSTPAARTGQGPVGAKALTLCTGPLASRRQSWWGHGPGTPGGGICPRSRPQPCAHQAAGPGLSRRAPCSEACPGLVRPRQSPAIRANSSPPESQVGCDSVLTGEPGLQSGGPLPGAHPFPPQLASTATHCSRGAHLSSGTSTCTTSSREPS